MPCLLEFGQEDIMHVAEDEETIMEAIRMSKSSTAGGHLWPFLRLTQISGMGRRKWNVNMELVTNFGEVSG